MEDYPFHRELQSPVTEEQLRPLDPRCNHLQFSEPLTDADHRRVSDFLRAYPAVGLRIYDHFHQRTDLEFLRFYPTLRRFFVDVFELDDFSGLRHLPADLSELQVDQTRSKRHSLEILRRFSDLRRLRVEGHTNQIDVLGTLSKLEELTLRSVKLPGLDFLVPCKALRSLSVLSVGTSDLTAIPRIGELKRLELWLVRGITDVDFVARLPHLQHLILTSLNQVRELPSFRPMKALRRVQLETMKGLTDLSPVARAPALEELLVLGMPQLEPESFDPFVGHPTLRSALITIKGHRKSELAAQRLGLPRCDLLKFEIE